MIIEIFPKIGFTYTDKSIIAIEKVPRTDAVIGFLSSSEKLPGSLITLIINKSPKINPMIPQIVLNPGLMSCHKFPRANMDNITPTIGRGNLFVIMTPFIDSIKCFVYYITYHIL